MLYSVEKNKLISKLPHQKEFNKWIKNISTQDIDTIYLSLNKKIDNDEIHTAGWIPGSNWQGTVYEPLYIGCNKDEKKAAMLFGVIVFKVFMERDDLWGFGKFEKDEKEIGSMTYYKLNNVNFKK